MTSQWVMTLLGMPHCGTTMGDNVTAVHAVISGRSRFWQNRASHPHTQAEALREKLVLMLREYYLPFYVNLE